MDAATAALAVLPGPALARFRELCGADGPLEPRFDGNTKHVLLTNDRAFLFPRNHTLVGQLDRECDVYATVDHPLVPKLLGRWHEPAISPYPFFAVTRLAGSAPARVAPEHLPALAAQLGAAVAACHNIELDRVPQRLWANPWQEPPAAPPTARDCYSPLRALGGAEHLAAAAAECIGPMSSATVLEALRAAEAMAPVLAHGDLHESQLLVDASGTLTGILDWGFGGALSPLVDFTGVRELFGADAAYGEVRRHMWLAYAAHRSAPLPPWEAIHLAMTAFDLTALAPETRSHYYWAASAAQRATRRAAARDCLLAVLGSRAGRG
jgi:aminoglycoside phosphotransferase (APT) family kinase protein